MRALAVFTGIAAFSAAAWRFIDRPALPDYGPAPEFVLQERGGGMKSLEDLRGKTWAANFIFTRCSGPCPLLSERMASLQREFSRFPDLRLVSFTVDPSYDRPAVLASYADRIGADRQRWWFLTGETAPVYDVVTRGFRQALQTDADGGQNPIHSVAFVLVDGRGRVRGYYTGTDEQAVSDLRRDIRRLS